MRGLRPFLLPFALTGRRGTPAATEDPPAEGKKPQVAPLETV